MGRNYVKVERRLYIGRTDEGHMVDFIDRLEKSLESIGLENLRFLGKFINAYTGAYGFQSTGEGGFVVEFEENQEVRFNGELFTDNRIDAVIRPIGATGSLIQRTYEHLKEECKKRGYFYLEKYV